MRRQAYFLLSILSCLFAAKSEAVCYVVYKSDVVIYRSSVAPVDMSLPLSQTVPSKFGAGATMVFQEWDFPCTEVEEINGAGTSTFQTSKSKARHVSLTNVNPSSVSEPLRSVPISNTNTDLSRYPESSSYGSSSYGSASGYRGVVQTGPRGGQFYINSNGNKTYTAGGNSKRGRY